MGRIPGFQAGAKAAMTVSHRTQQPHRGHNSQRDVQEGIPGQTTLLSTHLQLQGDSHGFALHEAG